VSLGSTDYSVLAIELLPSICLGEINKGRGPASRYAGPLFGVNRCYPGR